MDGWIFCEGDFMKADIIRWEEPIWEKRGGRDARWVRIGNRLVTAQVLREDPDTGFVTLLVREDRILEDKTPRKTLRPMEKDKEIPRKRESLRKGRPERMLWSEEEARAAVSDGLEKNGKRERSLQDKD